MAELHTFSNLSRTILIDGEFRRSTATDGHDVVDPATEIVLGEIAETTTTEVDAAVASGHSAQRTWWAMSGLERAEALHEVANDLLSRKHVLAETLTREMGKPYKESADEVSWSVSAIRYYAEIGRNDIGRVMGNAVAGHLNYTLKLPLGVVVSIQPTVLTDCTPDMDIFRNESFGPVAPICKVASFDEALGLANDSTFGLGACLYTTDMQEAIRATEELHGGMVWVNAPLLDNDAGPFGGTKSSGMGRQLGNEGLETFRQTKLVWIDPGCGAQDFWWFPYADAEAYPGGAP